MKSMMDTAYSFHIHSILVQWVSRFAASGMNFWYSRHQSAPHDCGQIQIDALKPSAKSKMSNKSRIVKSQLPRMHDGRFGFKVYRCVYGNDDEWEAFMQKLTEAVYNNLDEDGEAGEALKPLLEWNVEEDEGLLDGASKLEVRRLFYDWVQQVGGNTALIRYQYCIHVDSEAVKSVLAATDVYEGAFVNLLQVTHLPDAVSVPQADPEESYTSEDDNEERRNEDEHPRYVGADDPKPSTFPPLEGCTDWDVGWAKFEIEDLLPDLLVTLRNPDRWEMKYVRPPGLWGSDW